MTAMTAFTHALAWVDRALLGEIDHRDNRREFCDALRELDRTIESLHSKLKDSDNGA